MNKDHGRTTRRSTGERSAATSARRPKRGLSQPGSTANRETGTDRGLASPTADRRGGHTQDPSPLVSGRGWIAEALRHMRSERFKAVLKNAQQLVRKYPLQAVLVGVGLGFLLSRTKVG
jgi:hypothetical protein